MKDAFQQLFVTTWDIYRYSRASLTRLVITRIGYIAVSHGPQISAAWGEMGVTANNNAVINYHLFQSSCLSCTDVSRNNLMILRNLTQKYNCVAEFVVCCAPGVLSVCLKGDQFL